jgi:hypothetical protein
MIVRDIITKVSTVHNQDMRVPWIVLSVQQRLYMAHRLKQPADFESMSEKDPLICRSKWFNSREEPRVSSRPNGLQWWIVRGMLTIIPFIAHQV